MNYVGTLSTSIGFAIFGVIQIYFMKGSIHSIFFLSSILLLLPESKNINCSRYFPVILAISSFYTLYSIYDLFFGTIPSSLYLIKNTILIGLALPSHYYFLTFLWNFHHQITLLWLIIAPLCVLPIVFSDISGVRVLGIMGILSSGVQYIQGQNIKKTGRQII